MVDSGRFDPRYNETLDLGGATLRLRLIGAADKQKLSDGFHNLSQESRYRRFLVYKKALTAQELRFFTELDGIDHLAIGAFELDRAGSEGALVGVARWVRTGPDAAEFAVTVIDARQGRGVGRLLLERLAAAASERGILHLEGHVLPDNQRMQRLIKRFSREAVFTRDAELLTVRLPVRDFPPAAVQTPSGQRPAAVFDPLGRGVGGLLTVAIAVTVWGLVGHKLHWQSVGRWLEVLRGLLSSPGSRVPAD